MCESSPLRILALDVDGVLLDPARGGLGNWTVEMEHEFGITRPQIQQAFFQRSFNDVLNGRRSVESGFEEALSVRRSTMCCISPISGCRSTRRLSRPVRRQSDSVVMAMFF